jgi:tetratricopeptide (TPR) repeat protein
MVRLLEEASAALGPGDSPLVAKLGARRAAALMPPRSEEGAEQILTLARASIAMARRLGEPETLLYALDFARQGIIYMIPSNECFDLVRETVVLAQVVGQRLTLIKVGPSYAALLLERGARGEADAAVASLADLDATLAYPQARWRLPMLRAGFCLFEGGLDDAARLGDEALALAEQAGSDAGTEWALQRIAIAIARQQPAGISSHAARVLSILERGPLVGPTRAWVLAATGRKDEALALLRKAAAIPQGLPTLLLCADTCALVDDGLSASLVYEQLPKRSVGIQFYWGAARGYALGPTSRALGELARVLGRRDEARQHFEESIALCRRIDAKPFLELSLAALARLDAEGASSTKQGSQVGVRPNPPRPAARDVSLRREGDVWAVEGSAQPPFRLKHSKGLAYLSELLAHPGHELHVLTLVGLDHGASDAGPVLDGRAKADYKKRLEELEDEISEADRFGDEARANRAREEIDALATQLAGAVGLGGRDRRAASDVERARINVQRRLKDAIESVARCDPEAGRYLAAAITTGTYCSFVPL